MKKRLLFYLLALPLMAAAPDTGRTGSNPAAGTGNGVSAGASLPRAADATPAGFVRWTPATLAPMTQSLGAKAVTDLHHAATQRLGDFTNEYFLLAHREADGQAEWHENEVDVFVVQSGSATLIVGGDMPDAETVSPHEKRSASIQGGTRQKLSAGDIVRIPARTSHQLLLDGSHDFTYFVVKVKGY
jgi:mannose-6-phosphate isomerase-like protein (cupin superfamily)